MNCFKKDQDIDDYILMFREIYEPIQNNERSFYQILARLIESVAKCSQYVNKHNTSGIANQLPSLFSWYCSLVVKAKIPNDSICDILWNKYPYICPYCLTCPCTCSKRKATLLENSKSITEKVKSNVDRKPRTLADWQDMFADIYPRDVQMSDQKSNFIHLIEELGETAEAYRIHYFYPDNLANELTDVLTWIFGIANLLDSLERERHHRYILQEHVFEKYKGLCSDCQRIPCVCVPYESNPVISERNIVLPEHIYGMIEKKFEVMQSEIANIFQTRLAQEFVSEVRKQIPQNAPSLDIVETKTKELILESKYKKWYESLSTSGVTDQVLASTIFELLKSVFR